MTIVLFTTATSGTWAVPEDCPTGAAITVECWGGGSGASGRVSNSFGAAGGGGAYAQSSYIVTPNDHKNGIAYVVGLGSAGKSGTNPSAGGDTSFSTNNVNLITNSVMNGAVLGTPGTLPTGWTYNNSAGITTSIVGVGFDPAVGSYIDIAFGGTPSGTQIQVTATKPTVSASTTYVESVYVALIAGNATNVSDFNLGMWDSSGSVFRGQTYFTPDGTLSRYSGSGATSTTATTLWPIIASDVVSGGAISFTLRIGGVQMEAASTPTAWKSSPGFTLGKGGGAPATTTGGLGGSSTASIGTSTKNAGGAGAAYNASGSGGGGAGGVDGVGQVGTTAGVGGHGDGTTIGGAGGLVSATSPGNPGTANVEGGGGGGGLKTVAGTGGVGGAPGGGGGGAAVATSTGGAGADGQVQITYVSQYVPGLNYIPELAIQIWDH